MQSSRSPGEQKGALFDNRSNLRRRWSLTRLLVKPPAIGRLTGRHSRCVAPDPLLLHVYVCRWGRRQVCARLKKRQAAGPPS
jgi:hypothetical protein